MTKGALVEGMSNSCVLWKPESTSASSSTPVSFPQLAEFIVVTTARPVRDSLQLDAILESPPAPDMIAKMLRMGPLTADHFRTNVPIAGTFAVWVQSREGNHSLVIPRGYDGPRSDFCVLGVPGDDDLSPCLTLVTGLAQEILGKPVAAEAVLQCGMTTTRGDFTVFAFGVTVRCDVCGRPVEQGAGFTLSAKQIVSTPQYWCLRYKRNKGLWAEIGISSFDEYRSSQQVRDAEVRTILSAGSDWLVCDDCIVHFAVDREAARRLAAAWWTDRGRDVLDGWAATPSDVNMG
jgi:hypothetical protein